MIPVAQSPTGIDMMTGGKMIEKLDYGETRPQEIIKKLNEVIDKVNESGYQYPPESVEEKEVMQQGPDSAA
jgi:hypothetical protein